MRPIILLAFLIALISCKEEQSSQEEEARQLEKLLDEIENLASSVTCEDPSEWTFTAYGSKPCGGTVGYIAYAKSINTKEFLKKVEAYTNKQDSFNRKWGIVSDCSAPVQPSGVTCENGLPVFEY